jgi:hypothetical protein
MEYDNYNFIIASRAYSLQNSLVLEYQHPIFSVSLSYLLGFAVD